MLQTKQVLQGRYQLSQQLENNADRQTWLAVDLATQALQVAKTIKHPHFKARALAAIAHQLTAKGQYDQSLELAKTITDDSVKQIALKAIARYKISP
jgi:hypothetical protein